MSVYIRSRSTAGVKVEICCWIFFGLQQIVTVRILYKLPSLSCIVRVCFPKTYVAQRVCRISVAAPNVKCVILVCIILK